MPTQPQQLQPQPWPPQSAADKQAQLEKLLMVLDKATREQQIQILQKMNASPEMQHNILQRLQNYRLQRQQQQQQQQISTLNQPQPGGIVQGQPSTAMGAMTFGQQQQHQQQQQQQLQQPQPPQQQPQQQQPQQQGMQPGAVGMQMGMSRATMPGQQQGRLEQSQQAAGVNPMVRPQGLLVSRFPGQMLCTLYLRTITAHWVTV